jgi:hypothetical protein
LGGGCSGGFISEAEERSGRGRAKKQRDDHGVVVVVAVRVDLAPFFVIAVAARRNVDHGAMIPIERDLGSGQADLDQGVEETVYGSVRMMDRRVFEVLAVEVVRGLWGQGFNAMRFSDRK